LQTSESKASPLALLAATCSSIGKTDAEKKDLKTTTTTPTILSKLSPSQEPGKISSFKPYKLENRRSSPSAMRSSPPVLVSNSNIVSTKASLPPPNNMMENQVHCSPSTRMSEKSSKMTPPPPPAAKELDEYTKYQERIARDMKCHSVSPPLPHNMSPKVPMLPHHHHHHHHGSNRNHVDYLQCKTNGRPSHQHPELLSGSVRPSTIPPCSCPMCHSGRGGDGKCHIQPYQSLPGIYHPSHKGAPIPHHPPPVMQCRDPGCTNCTKMPPTKTLQNFVHPALAHQCTHTSPTHKGPYLPPPPSSVSVAYDPYFVKNGLSPHKPKPYVCNWVFEGKHCGNNFVTSEELYQHLRTHTSLQQQRNNENESRVTPTLSPLTPNHGPITSSGQPSAGCNIHGCPCNGGQRKPSPRSIIPGYPYGSPVSSGLRYAPYGRPVSAGGSSLPGHFGSHGMYHY